MVKKEEKRDAVINDDTTSYPLSVWDVLVNLYVSEESDTFKLTHLVVSNFNNDFNNEFQEQTYINWLIKESYNHQTKLH